MREYNIACIAGDGIGKEVVPEGIKILKDTAEKYQFKINFENYDFASCLPNLSFQLSGSIFPCFS